MCLPLADGSIFTGHTSVRGLAFIVGLSQFTLAPLTQGLFVRVISVTVSAVLGTRPTRGAQ